MIKCCKCGKPVLVDDYVNFEGQSYHARCLGATWRCHKCGKTVNTEQYAKFEGRVFHEKCLLAEKKLYNYTVIFKITVEVDIEECSDHEQAIKAAREYIENPDNTQKLEWVVERIKNKTLKTAIDNDGNIINDNDDDNEE